MKISHLSLADPAALMILGGCSKGATNNGEIEHKSERITVTLPASCPIRWQAGEQITIIGSSSNTFSILPGFSETEAKFEGRTVGGYAFKIIHPGTITSITGFENYDFTGLGDFPAEYLTAAEIEAEIKQVPSIGTAFAKWVKSVGGFSEDILGTDRKADGYIYPGSCQQ